MGQAWKDAEREVAKYFGGMRRCRVSYSEKIGDIIHPTLSIEVKYGKQIPKYCCYRFPTWVGEYMLTPSGWGGGVVYHFENKKCKSTKFLDKAFAQAVRYDKTKKAVVALKPRGMRGFIIVERREKNGRLGGEL